MPITHAEFPAGAVIQYAGATAPSGWLLCDGTAVSRDTYQRLFSAIGVSYGVGDNSTTFNLPDMRGRVPVGRSPGGKALVDALGDSDGRAASARSISHNHGGVAANKTMVTGRPGGSLSGADFNNFGDAQFTGTAWTGDIDNADYPSYLVFNYIIKI